MKKVLFTAFVLLLMINLRAQNTYPDSDIYFNNADTIVNDDRLKVSISLNRLVLNDSILRRYMDFSINESSTRGVFDYDGSGIFFLISFYGYYTDTTYFYCHITALRNSFMRYTLYDNIQETNMIESEDTIRLMGFIEYKGFLFIVMIREYVKDEDVDFLFEYGQGKKEIKMFGDYRVETQYDETVNYFLHTEELSIPYKKKRTKKLKKFK